MRRVWAEEPIVHAARRALRRQASRPRRCRKGVSLALEQHWLSTPSSKSLQRSTPPLRASHLAGTGSSRPCPPSLDIARINNGARDATLCRTFRPPTPWGALAAICRCTGFPRLPVSLRGVSAARLGVRRSPASHRPLLHQWQRHQPQHQQLMLRQRVHRYSQPCWGAAQLGPRPKGASAEK